MSKYRKRATPRNKQLDLFDWHLERELRRTNRAARRLAERFGISITNARYFLRSPVRIFSLSDECDVA